MQTSNIIIFIGSALGIIALFLSGFAVYKIYKLNSLKQAFFAGKNGINLDAALMALKDDLKSLEENQQTQNQTIQSINKTLGLAVLKVGVIKFNPFSDEGGNLSFCAAFLDAHDNGLILTNMHGRQQSRIYIKKITNGLSEQPLNPEEQEAILAAKQNFSKFNTFL